MNTLAVSKVHTDAEPFIEIYRVRGWTRAVIIRSGEVYEIVGSGGFEEAVYPSLDRARERVRKELSRLFPEAFEPFARRAGS